MADSAMQVYEQVASRKLAIKIQSSVPELKSIYILMLPFIYLFIYSCVALNAEYNTQKNMHA